MFSCIILVLEHFYNIVDVEYFVATALFNTRVRLRTVELAGSTGSYAVGANNNNKADILISPSYYQ